MPAIARLVHPAPTLAVVALSAALGAILLAQAARPLTDPRLLLLVITVFGSQILTGALNDWADRDRDRVAQPTKPIPAGELSPRAALAVASIGGAVQAGASLPLGPTPLVLGAVASASAVAYNLWLSRTPLSVAPYLVSFGLLPLWIAAGVGVPLDRVSAAPLLVGPFAAAAHLANTARDFEGDAALGSRSLVQVLGRRTALRLAWALAMSVGLGVGLAFAVTGRLDAPAAVVGAIGLGAVAHGLRGADELWTGMLVAAVCWTSSWALATAT